MRYYSVANPADPQVAVVISAVLAHEKKISLVYDVVPSRDTDVMSLATYPLWHPPRATARATVDTVQQLQTTQDYNRSAVLTHSHPTPGD